MTRPPDEDGYELWLRYRPQHSGTPSSGSPSNAGLSIEGQGSPPATDGALLARYREQLRSIVPLDRGPSIDAAVRELCRGLSASLAVQVGVGSDPEAPGALLIGQRGAEALAPFELPRPPDLGRDGFALQVAPGAGPLRTAIAGASELGALYGAFHLLRLIQCGKEIERLSTWSRPRTGLRLLDHWDDLDRSVERGYAGSSLWNWQLLPHYLDPRYTEYARACASIGINGSVLTSIDASALVLSEPWIEKAAALAGVFRPFGVRVYLPARFSAPIELDGLPSADPRDKDVKAWWQRRADRIYRSIPDFGGFVVQASSEGQPGPHSYGRSHAEGANLIADALAEHGGVLMWRAIATDPRVPSDRAKQAYAEFSPLDGRFRSNVMVQVKNGPLDFMPREPHHPLFGAMQKTPLMLEFQLTQEYLGQGSHLCYLGALFEECLQTDTYAEGAGSTLAAIVDGSLHGHALSGMCAVANVGTDRNWCGHPFASANWYAFGRMAWDHTLTAREIAEEWLRQTFSNEPAFLEPVLAMMLSSREVVVDYMAPLGLHHQMAEGHHYGPGPWLNEGRPDGTSVYYHRADDSGIGFDRTPSGSNAVEQYFDPLRRSWSNPRKCPEELLLWFHHVAWNEPLRSGRTLWQELCHRYQRGVDAVRQMQATWQRIEPLVDAARFAHTEALLAIQEREARWWRDACVLYFQTFSRLPLPEGYEPAEKTLEEYRALRHYFVPGIHNPFVPRTPERNDPTRDP